MKLNLSENIKYLRKSKGMTQEKLAELLNISSAAISKWESNDTYPDITMLFPLARIFGVSIDDLMGYNTSKIETEINSFIEEYKNLIFKGKWDEGRELIIKARLAYPDDYRIMDLYMWSVAGGSADNSPDVLNQHYDEFMQICNTLLDNCVDEKLRLNTINMKAKLLHAKGKTKEALEILEGFPSWYLTKEQKTEQLFGKETPEFRYWIRRNMYELFDFACNKLVKSIWYDDELSVDEKVMRAETFTSALRKLSKEEGWEFFSYIVSRTCGDFSSKLSFLTTRDDDIINFKAKQFEEARVATQANKQDKILEEYMIYNHKTSDYLNSLINHYETTDFASIKRLRENPNFINLLEKYKN